MLDNTTTYRKLQKDPTTTQEARIVRKQLQQHNGELTKSTYYRIREFEKRLHQKVKVTVSSPTCGLADPSPVKLEAS